MTLPRAGLVPAADDGPGADRHRRSGTGCRHTGIHPLAMAGCWTGRDRSTPVTRDWLVTLCATNAEHEHRCRWSSIPRTGWCGSRAWDVRRTARRSRGVSAPSNY